MLSASMSKVIKYIIQTRYLSCGVVLNESKIKARKPVVKLLKLKNPTKKKARKKSVIVKRVSDDIEAMWLENLTSENLKLYRKTSYGTYKVINLTNLFEKLKQIYPFIFQLSHIAPEKPISKITSAAEEKDLSSKKVLPYMSDYLIQNIVEFPLLKLKCKKSLFDFVSEEKEDFGNVDAGLFPSVTGILNETMSEHSKLKLKQWKDKMIATLGVQGFFKYQRDLLSQGSKFHSTIKTYLEVADKNLVTVDPQIEGCWKSLEKLLVDVSDVKFVEESLYHPILMYKGIVDCVASYRGTPCVIEWKKSEKPRVTLKDTYDAPLQLCAYLGALPWHKNVTIKNGLVVVAYVDGSPANAFEMSLEHCEVYWCDWLRRLQTYWRKKSPTVIQQEN